MPAIPTDRPNPPPHYPPTRTLLPKEAGRQEFRLAQDALIKAQSSLCLCIIQQHVQYVTYVSCAKTRLRKYKSDRYLRNLDGFEKRVRLIGWNSCARFPPEQSVRWQVFDKRQHFGCGYRFVVLGRRRERILAGLLPSSIVVSVFFKILQANAMLPRFCGRCPVFSRFYERQRGTPRDPG